MRISFQRVAGYQPPRWPDPAFPPRLHLDVDADDINEAEPKVLALGATRLPSTERGTAAASGTWARSGYKRRLIR